MTIRPLTVAAAGYLAAAIPCLAAGSPARIGESNPMTPPVMHVFDDYRQGMERDDFARYFQVIDANNDERSWGYYNYSDDTGLSKCAYMLYPIDKPQADDWLIAHAIRLEAGKYYCVSLDASLYLDGDPHRFEVKYGFYNDADGLDKTIIPPTEVSTRKGKHCEGWICPQYDAVYYIGVHGISTSKNGYLFIDNLGVGAATESTAPSGVTDMEVQNDPTGAVSVIFRCKAPATDLAGKPLEGKVTVTLTRDGNAIHTFADVEPGAELEYTDSPGAKGDYIYRFEASNASGRGQTVRIDRFVGIGAPLPPAITAYSEMPGNKVKIEWEAPATDVMGNPIDPASVTYDVYDWYGDGEMQLRAKDLTGVTEYTYDPVLDDMQGFAMSVLTARLGGETSAYAPTGYLAVGTPYPTPYEHSFGKNDPYRYIFTVETGDQNVIWKLLDDESDPDAQDGDNAYVAMVGNAPGQKSELQTGKIDLVGVTDPALTFYTYVYPGDENQIHVNLYPAGNGPALGTLTVDLSGYGPEGWHRVFLPLGEYSGEVVRLGFQGEIRTHGYIPLDNIRLAGRPAVDLTLAGINAPRSAAPGEEIEIQAEITNSGAAESPEATVEVRLGGRVIGTATCTPIAPLATDLVPVEVTMPADLGGASELTVTVLAQGDGFEGDNTGTVSVSTVAPALPRPQALKAAEEGGRVTLTWSAPDLTNPASAPVTEDFEGYADFSAKPGEWISVDADGGYVGGFIDCPMPVDHTQQGWWVMPVTDRYAFLDATSGTHVMAQMYGQDADGYRAVDCDDWLISPELWGGLQTVSFQAASISLMYGADTFEVWASEGSVDPADFHRVAGPTDTDEVWMEYHALLPEGSKRFAIRCISSDRYMMMLDDIRYIGAGSQGDPLDFKGYNVYREGERLTSAPIGAERFETSMATPGDKFYVTAVYGNGESLASEGVTPGVGSVNGIESLEDCAPEYYTPEGLKTARPDAPGIYIVRQGNKRAVLRVK